MSNLLFYHPHLDKPSFQLSEEESKHLTRVLRKKNGDEIRIMNGKGIEALVEIVNDKPKQIEVKVKQLIAHQPARNYKFHLAIAPTKNTERIEWLLEKCTEIGIDEITFITCKNSERSHSKPDRFAKIMLSALKQSKQFFLPKLNNQMSYNNFIQQQKNNNALKLIAWCESDQSALLKNKLAALNDNLSKEILVLIGPEGDFTAAEVELAKENQFEIVSLGNSILRTETAGLFVCSVLSNHFQ